MSEEFEKLTYLREECVEGIGPWVWPIADHGAWEGPSQEFASIRDAILDKCHKRDVIITAGGCCGMYPRLWAESFKKVFTFEPAPLNWYCLWKNCPQDHIYKYNAAVGERQTEVWLKIADYSNVGTNTISPVEDKNTITVPQVTIDSLNLSACDAIQLDIESYEPSAILGAAETIKTFRPVVCLETKNPLDYCHLMLTECGYKVSGDLRNDRLFVPI